jgi:hypothetical protein
MDAKQMQDQVKAIINDAEKRTGDKMVWVDLKALNELYLQTQNKNKMNTTKEAVNAQLTAIKATFYGTTESQKVQTTRQAYLDALAEEQATADFWQRRKQEKAERLAARDRKLAKYSSALQQQHTRRNLMANGWRETATGQWQHNTHRKYTIHTNGLVFTPKRNGAVMRPENRNTTELNAFLKEIDGRLDPGTTDI